MGIDAPSTDLTARIQQTRKRMILSGDLEPMRPGEHAIHGRAPGSSAVLDVDAVSRAADMRSRRVGADTVVEMDLNDYTGTQPGTKELAEAADADEAFEIGGETSDDETGFDLGPEGARDVPESEEEEIEFLPETRDPETDPEYAAAYAETLLGQFDEVYRRLDELGSALVMLATEVGGQLRELLDREPVAPVPIVFTAERQLSDEGAVDLAEELRAAFETPTAEAPSKWRAFLSAAFSGGSGPYE